MRRRESEGATNEEIPQTPWENRRRSHRLARQQVVRLASRREDRTRGYEMANSSMAVAPSGPCNVQGGLGAG
jgi:hypothetical protein